MNTQTYFYFLYIAIFCIIIYFLIKYKENYTNTNNINNKSCSRNDINSQKFNYTINDINKQRYL